jgi:hypothetical protein
MKILIMQFPPISRHFIPFGPNILLSTLFDNSIDLITVILERMMVDQQIKAFPENALPCSQRFTIRPYFSQLNPVLALTPSFLNIHFIIFPSDTNSPD